MHVKILVLKILCVLIRDEPVAHPDTFYLLLKVLKHTINNFVFPNNIFYTIC